MDRLSISGKGNIDEIAQVLRNGIESSGITCELIGEFKRSVGEGAAVMLVFEKYYMRSGNRASLSIMLTQSLDTVYVDAVGSGGGQGALFRFSWGAEENFVGTVARVLQGHGFN